ncbi:lectin BRA-3 [Biomphalaria glabrata]
MYCVRLASKLCLLITCLFLVMKYVDCQMCQRGLTYHRHTHTCLAVFNWLKTHEEADIHCANLSSAGHLVYILDAETNDFITNSLLRDGSWYHIGLKDSYTNGVYKWTNGMIANYTHFNANHRPDVSRVYVLMSTKGWMESYNYATQFICQTSAERNEFFFLNGSIFDNNTSETIALDKIVWNCGTYDVKDHQIELVYRQTDGKTVNLQYVFGNDMRHVMYPGCDSSGVYVCRIIDQVNLKVVSLEGILKVRCNATYCNAEDANQNLLVDGSTGYTEAKLCVFIYPPPTILGLYKDRALNTLQRSKFNISFSYTDEISSRGELHIQFYNMTSSDYGRYFIHATNPRTSWSRLYFNITGLFSLDKEI